MSTSLSKMHAINRDFIVVAELGCPHVNNDMVTAVVLGDLYEIGY
jgi:hypothetical protein